MAVPWGELGLLSSVSTLCCGRDSLYTQFCPSWAFVLQSACACDLQAVVIREQMAPSLLSQEEELPAWRLS